MSVMRNIQSQEKHFITIQQTKHSVTKTPYLPIKIFTCEYYCNKKNLLQLYINIIIHL